MLHDDSKLLHAKVPAGLLQAPRDVLLLTSAFATGAENVGRDDGKVPVKEIDAEYLREMILFTGVSPAEAVGRFPGGPVTAQEIEGLQTGAITLIEPSKWVWARDTYESLTGFAPSEPAIDSSRHFDAA